MKKKGFTLVELLAVIVILAIIAVIATPIILGVIDEAKKGAAKSSALGYLDALEKQVLVNDLNNKNKIKDGTYLVSDLKVDIKGKGPSQGLVIIEDKRIKNTRLCFDGVSVYYDGEKAKLVDSNYCSSDFKIKLNVAGTEYTSKNIGTDLSTEIEITEDISSLTNISCNNNAVPILEGNTLKISNIFGGTECNINNSLEETITNLDSTETNIVMLNDETVTNALTIKEDKIVTLDLNGQMINSSQAIFIPEGFFKLINKKEQGQITSSGSVMSSGEKSRVIIENVKLISTNQENASTICNRGYLEVNGNSYIEGPYGIGCNDRNNATIIVNNGTIKSTIYGAIALNKNNSNHLIVNNGYIYGKMVAVQNFGNEKGIVDINGGVFIGETSDAIYNAGNGTVNINQTTTPIYISSLTETWSPAILNQSTKNINIAGNIANECTSDYTKTTSGLCVYAGGNNEETGNGAVQNANSGTMNINGGTYYGARQGINNGFTGNINIVNAQISAGVSGILNNKSGIVNICNSTIYSAVQDLYKTGQVGTINYSNDVIFTDGTNTPVIGGSTVNVNPNYSGTCLDE